MTVEQVAKVAHEINRAYCISIGDRTQAYWEEAPQWQRDSAVHGVDFHLNNPDATPSLSHEVWMKEKVDLGWVYGEVKDAEKKTHPCILPYDELPLQQRTKDYLFKQVVDSLKMYIH
jgi:hypothetical protein